MCKANKDYIQVLPTDTVAQLVERRRDMPMDLGANPSERHILSLFRCVLSFSATVAKRWEVQFRLGLAKNSTMVTKITGYKKKLLYKYTCIFICIINEAEKQLNLTDITIHIYHGIEINTFSYHQLTDIHFLHCHCHLGDTLRLLKCYILNFTFRTIHTYLSKKCVLPLNMSMGNDKLMYYRNVCCMMKIKIFFNCLWIKSFLWLCRFHNPSCIFFTLQDHQH